MSRDWLRMALDLVTEEVSSTSRAAACGNASERRVQRLLHLIEVLRDGEANLPTIMTRLGCSHSTARNYVCELLDAGIIRSSRPPHARGRISSAGYTLSDDAQRIERFIRERAVDGRPQQAQADSAQYRDPLVLALFGNTAATVADTEILTLGNDTRAQQGKTG